MFTEKFHQRIITDPEILIGKPVIKGTRVPVELILKLLAQGTEVAEILEEYPRLAREDILAAIDYAHDVVATEEVYRLQPA
ncbi:MAG: antitoxin [Candidatus Magasanikbacteria bacterium RIFCSPHIGHO2_02_FULL_51_14]|uniref:Antitoxin n=1 Tax=Candidatus Magasanikbacteria bacterium RIFCSPHIGHO2_02_FULL_51_14 TaxID=1798683 RepID=A0A1F6ME45_9BACT|nr:MAG: antitoxin [Candidatus Magasanikbacteria bacterium RIFCSPHIGHO2_02_FULL_51_14]